MADHQIPLIRYYNYKFMEINLNSQTVIKKRKKEKKRAYSNKKKVYKA